MEVNNFTMFNLFMICPLFVLLCCIFAGYSIIFYCIEVNLKQM